MATKHGLGRHIEFLDAEERTNLVRSSTAAAALTVAASVWSKVSYALFLLRISSSGCTQWTKNGILGIIISLNMMLPVVTTTFFISCRPIEKNWRPEAEGTCWHPQVKVHMAQAIAEHGGVVPSLLRADKNSIFRRRGSRLGVPPMEDYMELANSA
ncbi:hypothetical protein OQA88_9172 [Cercophora sp. LCS_1]